MVKDSAVAWCMGIHEENHGKRWENPIGTSGITLENYRNIPETLII
jgi:hypothetical protein